MASHKPQTVGQRREAGIADPRPSQGPASSSSYGGAEGGSSDAGPCRDELSNSGGDLAERSSTGDRGYPRLGAVVANVASERYELLWLEYSSTADELHRLLNRRTAADGCPISGSELVGECEQVIAVQNQPWMTRVGRRERSLLPTDSASRLSVVCDHTPPPLLPPRP
jgi:hypothetical protein